LAGVVFRFRDLSSSSLIKSIAINLAVFIAVGIGYVFSQADHGRQSANAKELLFIIACIPSIYALVATLRSPSISSLTIVGLIVTFTYIFTYFALTILLKQHPGIVKGLEGLLVLSVIGLLNAILGTVVAGFTISAALYLLVSDGTLKDIFFWASFFEFFSITSTGIKLLIAVGISLLSAVGLFESISSQ
jgi:hypothetical protein